MERFWKLLVARTLGLLGLTEIVEDYPLLKKRVADLEVVNQYLQEIASAAEVINSGFVSPDKVREIEQFNEVSQMETLKLREQLDTATAQRSALINSPTFHHTEKKKKLNAIAASTAYINRLEAELRRR